MKAQEDDKREILALEEKHSADLARNRSALEEKLPGRFKKSAELLNLSTIRERLSLQQDFKTAHQVAVRAAELEERERQQYMVDVHRKILASESTLLARQGNEMAALKKKLEARMNEKLKEREVQHNWLLQRYQNVKREIENAQNIQKVKREREYHIMTDPLEAHQRSVMAATTASKLSSTSKVISSTTGKTIV